MKNEYAIINKTFLEDKIQELKNQKREHYEVDTGTFDVISMAKISQSIDLLTEILSQSTPLIPEIDAAIQFGKDVIGSNTFINTYDHNTPFIDYYDTTTETCQYISDLKLNI